MIDRRFQRVSVSSWPEAMAAAPAQSKILLDIQSDVSPARWVETVAQAAKEKHLDGIVTAPLSKTLMRESGIKEIGHTEVLKKVSGSKATYMTFLGQKFNVLLMTGHTALRNVADEMNTRAIENALKAAHQVRSTLPSRIASRPIALVGLNPHAGENGIIGKEEGKFFYKAIEKLKGDIEVVGPLVPDAAFLENRWKEFSIYVCPYHDMGLIPFKLVHGQNSGVHITHGIDFVRTSVDHGTAKDIFGKNKANPNSMIEAIDMAVKMGRARNKNK